MQSIKAAPQTIVTPAPIFNMTFSPSDPTPVMVTNEVRTDAQPAPIVNVNVEPTPVNVTNNVEVKQDEDIKSFAKSVRKLAKDSKA